MVFVCHGLASVKSIFRYHTVFIREKNNNNEPDQRHIHASLLVHFITEVPIDIRYLNQILVCHDE